MFSVSYEMAAHRFTNLATHHLDLTCHFVKNDESGIIYKAYENDGLVLPADSTGAIEGQRMCRKWSGRQVFGSADRYSPYYQYSDTPAGTFWCMAHVDPGAERGSAITLGTGLRELALVPRPGHHQADGVTLPGRGLLPAAAGRAGHPLGRDGLAVGAGPLAHPVRPADRELSGGGRVRRVRVPGPPRRRVAWRPGRVWPGRPALRKDPEPPVTGGRIRNRLNATHR